MIIKEQKHASELMPTSEKAIEILQARAKQLAKQEIDASENNSVDFICFRLGQNESYGVPYQYVQEVLRNIIVAKPPFVPKFIAGIINWRGALITIVDPIKFFHPNHSGQNAEHNKEFIIIINVHNITLGLLANRIEGSENYQPSQLSLPLSSVDVANPEYILGINHSTTAILNIEVLIPGLVQEIKKSLYRIGEVHGNCY